MQPREKIVLKIADLQLLAIILKILKKIYVD